LTTSQDGANSRTIICLEKIARRLPWPIYLAGDDKHFNDSTGLLRQVNPLGPLTFKERRAWFACASIYALPARYEPFGLAALEAALAGCALVLSDIPSLREVWGDAALYAPPDDPLAWEVALVLLMADSTYRRRMAKRAYSRAQKFTSERMAAHYLAHCQQFVTYSQRTA
jgi:glycosyltransferase involved in cell wall biosynthesis